MDIQEDWDVAKTEDSGEDEAIEIKYEITNYPADTTLSGYLRQWENKQLDVPPFQRGYVWDQIRASRLIESFLLGLPVPGVFLYKERKSSRYLIVDGLQRIRSIVSYLQGEFGEKKFRLKGISNRWIGKSFDELDDESKFNLQNAVMRSTIIQQISPDDHTSIYHIFERLNTGGVNLTPMEIRQCIASGPFVAVLNKMNKDANWRKIVGREEVDKRMRDVELVLRVVALAENNDKYEKPMKGFLNEYMEGQKLVKTFSTIEKKFSQVCKQVVDAVGDKPFHYKGRLNFGFLDAVLVVLFAKKQPQQLKTALENLKKDDDFVECITKNTSDASILKKRLSITEKIFASS